MGGATLATILVFVSRASLMNHGFRGAAAFILPARSQATWADDSTRWSTEMTVTRRMAAISGLSLFAGSAISGFARADWGSEFANLGEGLEDFWVATDAYIYGYPLVTMEMTRRIMTNV